MERTIYNNKMKDKITIVGNLQKNINQLSIDMALDDFKIITRCIIYSVKINTNTNRIYVTISNVNNKRLKLEYNNLLTLTLKLEFYRQMVYEFQNKINNEIYKKIIYLKQC